MQTIELWNEYHIVDYVRENIADFSKRFKLAGASCLNISRNEYRTLVRTLEKASGVSLDKIKKSCNEEKLGVAAACTLLEFLATAEPEKGVSVRFETIDTLPEALDAVVVLCMNYLLDSRPDLLASIKAEDKPKRIHVYDAADIERIVSDHIAEYDRAYTVVIDTGMSGDEEDFESLLKEIKESSGLIASKRIKKDLVELGQLAGRVAALSVLTANEEDGYTAKAKNLKELDAALKVINKTSFEKYVSNLKPEDKADFGRIVKEAKAAADKHEMLRKMS